MVGVRVCENGDVQYYVNGENKGRVFQHLPTNKYQDWWGVVCLRARIKIQSEFHYGEYTYCMLDTHSTHLDGLPHTVHSINR